MRSQSRATIEVYQKNIRSLDSRCDLLEDILDGLQVRQWHRLRRGGSHVAKGRKGLGVRTDLRRAGEFRSARVNARTESFCILVEDLEELLAEQERLFR
jgi:hypothetical protein